MSWSFCHALCPATLIFFLGTHAWQGCTAAEEGALLLQFRVNEASPPQEPILPERGSPRSLALKSCGDPCPRLDSCRTVRTGCGRHVQPCSLTTFPQELPAPKGSSLSSEVMPRSQHCHTATRLHMHTHAYTILALTYVSYICTHNALTCTHMHVYTLQAPATSIILMEGETGS